MSFIGGKFNFNTEVRVEACFFFNMRCQRLQPSRAGQPSNPSMTSVPLGKTFSSSLWPCCWVTVLILSCRRQPNRAIRKHKCPKRRLKWQQWPNKKQIRMDFLHAQNFQTFQDNYDRYVNNIDVYIIAACECETLWGKLNWDRSAYLFMYTSKWWLSLFWPTSWMTSNMSLNSI